MNSMILKKAFLEGYATSTLDINTMFICVAFTAIIGIYIYMVYKLINKNSFYNRGFNLSLIALAIITSAIILTIQSNIVVSLGMVGALSIIRFRTAIKDPMDLVFLFWSISAGIICGAGFAMIAVIASIILTIVIIIVSILPAEKGSMVLIVNTEEYNEEQITAACDKLCQKWKVRARNISKGSVNLAIEVTARHPQQLIEGIMSVPHVTHVSLVEHDGDITA